MKTTLIKNIKSLLQTEHSPRKVPVKGEEMAHLAVIKDAFLLIEGEKIKTFGVMADAPERTDEVIDARGKIASPCWCDSHSHLVFAASREAEFEQKIQGLSYEEIAKSGGGILNSAKRLRETEEEQLVESAMQRLEEVKSHGTGAIEIKSGYGLSLEGELKMLRVIRRLKELSDLTIKATFLGAHALPPEYKTNREEYIKLVTKEMLPRIGEEDLADYIDVFCEKGFFTPEETEKIIIAGKKYGLKAKIHTNQFNSMGGIEASVRQGALSVDHLEVVNEAEISALQKGKTIATLLPSAPFFLNDPYPPARKLINARVPIALASDYNPGSSPSGKIPFVLSLACIKMKLTPEEVIHAATINGAFAMDIAHDHGSIAPGKIANIFITKPISSLAYIPYAFGGNHIEEVFIKGKRQ